jgi:hypothetical protein
MGASAVVLHVPQAILSVDEALGEEGVVKAPGARVGGAVRVTPDVHPADKAVKALRAREVGERGSELGPSCGHCRLP